MRYFQPARREGVVSRISIAKYHLWPFLFQYTWFSHSLCDYDAVNHTQVVRNAGWTIGQNVSTMCLSEVKRRQSPDPPQRLMTKLGVRVGFCRPLRVLELSTHWGRVTHLCVGKLTNVGSDNGLSSGRSQAVVWTNAETLLIGPWGTKFSEILIEIYTFSLKKMCLKMSSAKWRPFFSASMC